MRFYFSATDGGSMRANKVHHYRSEEIDVIRDAPKPVKVFFITPASTCSFSSSIMTRELYQTASKQHLQLKCFEPTANCKYVWNAGT